MVCLHATDPSTVYLSAWARVDGMAVPDLERALYVDRSLVKHLAMRRTLFVFPRATLSFAQAGASDRVADTERRRLDPPRRGGGPAEERRALAEEGERAGPRGSVGRAGGHVVGAARRDPRCSRARSRTARGSRGAGNLPVGPRVLTTLSAAGRIVRASNDGGWTTSRPRWTSTASWLGEEIAPRTEAEGVAGWSSDGCARSARGRSRTSSGGSGPPSRPHGRRWSTSTRSRSISTARPATCCPTTWSRPPRSSRGRRSSPRSTRPRWAGSSATGTSARTRRSCSTRTATPDPPPGGTAGSSAAGARPRPARSSSSCSRTSAREGDAPSRTRRRA